MSLLPVNSFPGMLFLEARMVGQTSSAIISQIGISIDAPDANLAVFSRTSGVLLVAGVGSYCAYRICTKFLGRSFVWTILDTSQLDRIPTADRRLLYNSESPEEDNVECEEGDTNSESEWLSRVSGSRGTSEFARLSKFRKSTKTRGLFNVRQPKSTREGVLSRQSGQCSSAGSQKSFGARRYSSSSLSDKSCSLRIVWEGQQDWDDEFEGNEVVPSREWQPPAYPSTSSPLPLAASVGDLCSVFDDVLSVTSALEHHEQFFNDAIDEEEVEDPENEQIRDKCMKSSRYMYRSLIVPGSEMGSENGSICGESVISTTSNLDLLRKSLLRNSESNGLWNLTDEQPSSSKAMTDSGLTTASIQSRTSNTRNNCSLFDSAIGADLLSSDDEGDEHFLPTRRMKTLIEADTISIAQSETSMEWFDDGFRSRHMVVDDMEDQRVPVDGQEWDFDSKRSSSAQSSPSHMPHRVCSPFRPQNSRDLMVFACEHYQPYSPQFKLLQRLYHRQRLKRIGSFADSTPSVDSQIKLICSQLFYHGYKLRRRVVEHLEDTFQKCLLGFDFFKKWNTNEHCSLHQHLLHFVAANDFEERSQEIWRGLKVLLTMEACEIFNDKQNGNRGLDWMTLEDPAKILETSLSEMHLHFITRLFESVSFDVVSMPEPVVRKIGSDATRLTLIQMTAHTPLLPLLYVSE